jgi:hypothetical protein
VPDFCILRRVLCASSQADGCRGGEWVKFKHTNSPTQEPIMKVRKNLEAVFLVAAVVTNFANYAVAKVPSVHVAQPVKASAVVAKQDMQVVVIKGHRLTAAEKAALN